MIGIKLEDGQFLTLPPDTSIRTELLSDLFYEDQGSYSFPFTIPIEGNSEKLGYPEAIMKPTSVKKFNVFMLLTNNIWKKAVLRIRNIAGKNYTCNINVEGGVLASDVANKKLKDLALDGDRVIRIAPYVRLTLTGAGTTGNVSLALGDNTVLANRPIKTVPFNGTIAQTLLDLAAAFMADSTIGNHGILSVVASGNEITGYSNIDYIKTNYNFSQSPAGTGRIFTEIDDDMTEEMIEHMNTVAIGSYPDYDYTFFPLKNPGFYDETNAEYKDYVNYHDGSSFIGNEDSFTDGLTYKYAMTPFPYMLYILKKALQEHNLKLIGDFTEDEEISKLVIYNNYSCDKLIRSSGGANVLVNAWAGSISLQNHVPDITVGEYIKAVKSRWALGFFYYNEKGEAHVKTKNEVLESTDYEDWTHLAEPLTDEETLEDPDGFTFTPKQDSADSAFSLEDTSIYTIKDPVETVDDLPETDNEEDDLRLVQDINHYYKVSRVFDVPSGDWVWEWEFYTLGLGSFKVDNGAENIDLRSGTLTTLKVESVDWETTEELDLEWLVPYANQKGSSPEFSLGTNPFSLRFLFYRGFQPGRGVDDVEITYPLGTPYKKNFDDDVIGSRVLTPDESYTVDHKKWIDFLATTRPIKINIRLTPEHLKNLDYSLKKRINNVMYLLAKVDVTNTMKGTKVSPCLFYKIT